MFCPSLAEVFPGNYRGISRQRLIEDDQKRICFLKVADIFGIVEERRISNPNVSNHKENIESVQAFDVVGSRRFFEDKILHEKVVIVQTIALLSIS